MDEIGHLVRIVFEVQEKPKFDVLIEEYLTELLELSL